MSQLPPSSDPGENEPRDASSPGSSPTAGGSSSGPLGEQSGRPGSAAVIWSSDGRRRLLERHRWLVFVLPFAVYMAANSLESDFGHYPLFYTLKITLTVAAIWFVLPGYREFAFRIGGLSLLVGAVGILVWIGFFHLGLEQTWAPRLGLSWLIEMGSRSGFDPLAHWPDSRGWAWGFLAVRFFGLVLVVPVIEEFFLRGFLMRFFITAQWWKIPFGTPHLTAIVITTLAAVAMHPAELLAELVWFSLVTGLMLRTRNIWDCVAAHAVTNLLLGVYVVWSGAWELM